MTHSTLNARLRIGSAVLAAFVPTLGQDLRFEPLHRMLPADADASEVAALADVDGDGDLDLALGDGLFLNRGDGRFVDVDAALLPAGWGGRSVALGDVDGDLDVDLHIAKDIHQGQLYRNTARQLASRHTPRVGKPLRLDLYGAPGGAFVLFGSSLGVGGGAGSWRRLGAGTLGPDGRAAFVRDVPLDPALVGLSYQFRARVDGGATNLERIVLTAL